MRKLLTYVIYTEYDLKKSGNTVDKACRKRQKNILARAAELRKYAKGRNISLAVSHNSYAHALAAKSLGIRYVTIMDYEYQPANHINFRLANKILVRNTIQLNDISRYGAKKGKLIKYPGIKEEVYLWQFEIDKNFWPNEFPQLNCEKVMCTVRPPATMAAYHDFENPIFNDLLNFILTQENVQIVFFPRTDLQRQEYAKIFPDLFIANKSVEGAQLIANSDLVISAGGTMNREAAVLGTQAYTIYAGKMGSVDRYLLKNGKIKTIGRKEDFQKIQFEKKAKNPTIINRKVFDFIIQELVNYNLNR